MSTTNVLYKARGIAVTTWVVLFGFLSLGPLRAQEPQVIVTNPRNDRELARLPASERLVLELPKDRGIGRAMVQLPESLQLEQLQIHAPLGGLESFSVSDGETEVQVSVNSSTRQVRCSRIQLGNERREMPLEFDAMDAPQVLRHVMADETSHTLGFTILIPMNDFDPQTRTLTIQWIDFYR